MSNDVPKSNGLGGVLVTLASSGDNWVKLLIVGGIILNTVWTKNNSTGIKHNTSELDGLRITVARQVKVIYDNQRAFADFMDETRAGIDRLQTKLDISHPPATPYPRQEVPDYVHPYEP
jgi:hypothetical protein